MNHSSEEVINGLMNYIDHEVMGKLPTSGKWVMGTIVGLSSNKAHHIVESLKTNPVVAMLDIVDDDNNIDTDAIIRAMRTSAEKYGAVTMDVPLVGRLTFTPSDVDMLKNYIG